jgi:hypothetical protein
MLSPRVLTPSRQSALRKLDGRKGVRRARDCPWQSVWARRPMIEGSVDSTTLLIRFVILLVVGGRGLVRPWTLALISR